MIHPNLMASGALVYFLALTSCGDSASSRSEEADGAGASASGGTTSGAPTATGGTQLVGPTAGLTVTPGRGIYTEPVTVTVEHPMLTSVRFTLDGGDPRHPEALTAELPLTLTIDPADPTNRYVAPGVILRLTAAEPDGSVSSVVTHTYLFNERVAELSPDEAGPGGDWPENGEVTGTLATEPQRMDYGIDPDIVDDPTYGPALVDALNALPSISLVTDLENLFDPQTGIYVNAEGRGREWERFGSVEILGADDGSNLVQANAGIRIRGGSSRSGYNPKHAFKLFFRGDYGPSRLEAPIFGEGETSSFDKLDLRTTQNYSWSKDSDEAGAENTMNRDVFTRDLHGILGQPYTRSRYYHLYLDGVYWGIFQSEERPDADFAETYLGGDKDDYDVVKVASDLEFTLEVTDGTFDAWQAVWQACQTGFDSNTAYYQLEGKDESGQRDPNLPVLVDLDNLIDFMLVVFYTGNFDAPVSKWFQNGSPNNFFALNSRTNSDQGFVFIAHDNEHSLLVNPLLITSGLDEDRVNIGRADGARDGEGNVDPDLQMEVTEFENFHPQWLHERLTANELYRQRFSARAHELLGGGGPLTAERALATFDTRAAELEPAIVAESARWGDAQMDVPRTKTDDWEPAIARIREEFFPQRTDIVIGQLQSAGLF